MDKELVEKIAEIFFREVAGFTWALFIVLALCTTLGAEGLKTPVLALVLTGVCYWIGSKVLDPAFDRIYSPGQDYLSREEDNSPKNSRVTVANAIMSAKEFKKPEDDAKPNPKPILNSFFSRHLGRDDLNDKRENAARELFRYKFPHAGLYSCCKQLLQPTKIWSEHIESWVQLSKFARTFAVLFFFVVVADGIFPHHWIKRLKDGGATHESTLQDDSLSASVSKCASWLVETGLSTLWIAIFLCLIAMIVSFGARFKHMWELYSKAAGACWVEVEPLVAAGSGSAGASRAHNAASVVQAFGPKSEDLTALAFVAMFVVLELGFVSMHSTMHSMDRVACRAVFDG